MKRNNEPHDSYVSRAHQNTEPRLLELLEENESSRRNLAALGSAKLSLEGDVARLGRELVDRQSEADEHRRQLDRLRGQLAEVEAANRSFSERFDRVTRQNQDLESLYVAVHRLTDSLDRSDLLQAVDEIIINLIGCEEYGVFELKHRRGEAAPPDEVVLELAVSSRIDRRRYRTVSLGVGPIGRAAATGEPSGATAAGPCLHRDGEPAACIPLKLGDRVIGVIALFRLLPQKSERLEELDLELLDLLAYRAAAALYCSRLHATHQETEVAA